MENVISMLLSALKLVFQWVLEFFRIRHRRESHRNHQRLVAYTQFLSAMDTASATWQEYMPLRTGLHWWNGRGRLKLMRATGLDARLLSSGHEVCIALELVRAVGSPAAVAAAEGLLEVVAAPAIKVDKGDVQDMDLELFAERRNELLNTVRRDVGYEPLRAA